MGVPVYTELGRAGGIRLVEGYTSDLTGLSSGEAEALALVASPASMGVQSLVAPTRTALDKLVAAVPSMHQLRAQHARGRLLFDTKPWFRSMHNSPYLDQIRTCIWKDQCIELRYQRSDGEIRDYRVEPYALVVKVDTWYVIGYVIGSVTGRAKRELRVFRMSRVQTMKEGVETFTRDPNFDLHKYWHSWCERFESNPPSTFPVEIAITPKGRKHLLECYGNWFRKQLEPMGDKFKRAEITLELDREDLALRILFGLGGEAQILKPRALRRKLCNLAQQVVDATKAGD
jgi:predicted DNA-binding transcriptional regulator YafY